MADGKFTLIGDVQLKINPAIKRQIAEVQGQLNNLFGSLKLSAPIIDEAELHKAARGVKKLDTEVARTEARLERFGRDMGKYFTRFASYTVAASGVFKVFALISKATDEAIEFDNRLVRLRQITGSTRSELSELTKETFRLATGLGVSQANLTSAAETLAQAGYTAKQAKQALEALAKAEVAPTFKNMEETTDGLIATLNQFNKKTSESEKVLSQLNAVAAAFAVESSDLIKGIQRTGGVFAQSGAELEQFLALFTAVRATTREAPETIAQGLKTIATRLQRTSTDEFLKRLGIYGIRDAATKEFVGVYKAVEILSNGIKKFSQGSPELAAIIEELGGVRQVGKVLPLLNNFATAQKALQVAQQGSNSLTKDSIIAQESLSRQFAKTREEFTKLIISMLENRGVKDLIKDILELTRTIIGVVASFEKVRPYLALISAVKIGRGAAALFRGATKGEKGTTHFAEGGRVPGRGTKDDFPAVLMRGEYVVSQKGVDSVGTKVLDQINSGRLPKLAGGTPGGTGPKRRPFASTPTGQKAINEELKDILGKLSLKELSDLAIFPDKLNIYKQLAEQTAVGRNLLLSLPQNTGSGASNINHGLRVSESTLRTRVNDQVKELPISAQNAIKDIDYDPKLKTKAVANANTRKITFNPNQGQSIQVLQHEAGHIVDYKAGEKARSIDPSLDYGASNQPGTFQNFIAESLKPERQKRLTELKKSGKISAAAKKYNMTEAAMEKYFLSNQEIFADFYSAQTKEIQSILGSTTNTQSGLAKLSKAMGGLPNTVRSGIGVKEITDKKVLGILGKVDPRSPTDPLGKPLSAYGTSTSTTKTADNLRKLELAETSRLLKKGVTYDQAIIQAKYTIGQKYAEMATESKKQSSLFSKITAVTTKLYNKTTQAVEPTADRSRMGQFADKIFNKRFTNRAGKALAGSSTALLLASNSELFNTTVDNLYGSGEKGASVAGGIRGGLTGLAIGSSFGPLGAAAGTVAGALIGAAQAAKTFQRNLEEKSLALSTSRFESDPKLDNLISKINDVNTSVGTRLLDENFNSFTGRTDTSQNSFKFLQFAEAEKINRQTFAEESIKNNLPQNIDKVIKDLIDSKKIKTPEDLANLKKVNQDFIDSANQNIGTKQISLFDVASRGTNKTADEKLKEYEAYLKNRQELDALGKTLTVLKRQFTLISADISKFRLRMDNFVNSLPDTNIPTISDPQSLVNRFSGLNKVGTRSFEKSVSELPISEQDKQFGFGANRARFALQNTLSRANPNVTSAQFGEFVNKDLRDQLKAPADSPFIQAINNSINEEDFTKFAEKLRHGIKEPLEELLSSAGITGIEEDLKKVGSSFSQFSSEMLKNAEAIYSTSAGNSGERIGLGLDSLRNKRTISDLYGGSTTAGLDNAAITGGVAAATGTSNISALENMLSNFDKLASSGPGFEVFAEASKYVANNLKRLGDVSARTGDIMTRLNEVERSRSAKIGLRESFITGTPESRRELGLNLGVASGFAKSGGGIGAFSKLEQPVQKAVLQGLRAFGDATIGGTGKSGNKIADDLLSVGLSETKEKDTLVASLSKITSETERINTFLLTRMENINNVFIRDYASKNAEFLSGLSGIFGTSGRTPIRRASGGVIPGSGNTDSVNLMAMPGEYVLPKNVVNKVGVDNLNRFTKFAKGGYVRDQSKRDAYLAAKAAKRNAFLESRGMTETNASDIGMGYSDPIEALAQLRNAKRGKERTRLRDYYRGKVRENIQREGASRRLPTTTIPGLATEPFSEPKSDYDPTAYRKDLVYPKIKRKSFESSGIFKDISGYSEVAELPDVSGYMRALQYEVKNSNEMLNKPYNPNRGFGSIMTYKSTEDDIKRKIGEASSYRNVMRENQFRSDNFKNSLRKVPKGGFNSRGFALGGHVPGSGNTDSVNAKLMPGEYVLNKNAVKNIGVANLNKLNKVQNFANGGVVDNPSNSFRPLYSMRHAGTNSTETRQTAPANLNTSGLDKFNNLFGLNVEKLNQAAAAIPHTIAMNVNHKLEVIFNGAQVFAELQPTFANLAQTMITAEINRMIKEKIPDVGPMS